MWLWTRPAARCGWARKRFISYTGRSLEELPARKEEVEHAIEEGVEFKLLTNPVSIEGENGFVAGMKCAEMVLGEPDASGRRRPVEKEGSAYLLECDCVIMAIGTSPNPLIKTTTEGLKTADWGGIIADEATGQTSRAGVFARGDAVTGAATVILAMGAGKRRRRPLMNMCRKRDSNRSLFLSKSICTAVHVKKNFLFLHLLRYRSEKGIVNEYN